MNAIAFFGTLEVGLVYGLVALGVYLTFRVLDFPDLTVDGSFPMGAAVAATLIVSGTDPWIATFAAILVSSLTGLVTAFSCVFSTAQGIQLYFFRTREAENCFALEK